GAPRAVTAPPDEPRWLQARAIIDAGGWRRGRVVGHDDSHLAVALPGAVAEEIGAALRDPAGWTLLVPEGGDRLARALEARRWTPEPAALYTMPDGAALPDDQGAVELTDDTRAAALADLEPALRGELGRAPGPLVAAYVDGAAAAFAHAPWRTARWFEL